MLAVVFLFWSCCHHVSKISCVGLKWEVPQTSFTRVEKHRPSIPKHDQIATHWRCWNHYWSPGYRLARQAGDRVPVEFNEKHHSVQESFALQGRGRLTVQMYSHMWAVRNWRREKIHLEYINVAVACGQQMEWLIQFPPNWISLTYGFDCIE